MVFVLEESQLVEDNITSKSLASIYKVLRNNESSNNREPLVELLKDDKFIDLVGVISEHFEQNNDGGDNIRLSQEQKDEIQRRLDLDGNDVATLIMIISATFTNLFVIDNFTGPSITGDSNHLIERLPDLYRKLEKQYDFKSLSTADGSEIYHLVINPWLLKLAQLTWKFLSNFDKQKLSRRSFELEFLMWKHRYLTIYLSILHESSEPLVNDLRKIQEFIFDQYVINDLRENKTQLTRFNIVELCCELIHSGLLREDFRFCQRIYNYASELAGISIEHTGVLGKRTRFQQNDIPQLLIRVNKATSDHEPTMVKNKRQSDLPKDIELDDDTLLPDVSFVKNQDDDARQDQVDTLSLEGQILMLANLNYILKSEVMEESLKDEWTLAYVRTIIKSANIWSVKYKALAIRSMVEKKHMRKMDRALRQLEELIKATDIATSNIGSVEEQHHHSRMYSFYSALPLARWQVQRSLGDISFDLGLFKNALDVYSRIEYWEGMIRCHNALGETVKAERFIRQELAKDETPYLYCLLGDATENIEHYEKSWQLSGGRFSRAKKSIGTYFYVRKDYTKAIENYEAALSASPSNISILSLLAYSCLITERYERAAECYRNITYHDDSNFLVWNNLSKAYIKLNQKERAWRTLREAIKCNYEEWKVWDNFMLVSLEIGALDDVILAWHRLLDLKTVHKDDKILSALTYSLLKKSHHHADDGGDQIKKLLSDAIKLVARIQAAGGCSARVWICYFRLLICEHVMLKKNKPEEQLTKTDLESRISKLTSALQRATPTSMLTTSPNWHQCPEKVSGVLDDYSELIDCYELAIDTLGTHPKIWSQWRNFKLSIGNTMKVLRQNGYCDQAN